MPKILLIDDSDVQRALIGGLVRNRLGYDVIEAAGGQEALGLLHQDTQEDIAAVLLDLSMPDMDGRKVLPEILALRPDLAVIMITGTQDVSEVVEMIKLGASDYLVKPPNPDLLRNALVKALRFYEMRREINVLRQGDATVEFGTIIGQSTAIRNCTKLAKKAASSDITVFITGESGVGKEVLAQAIHKESDRASKPFVAINCGAIPKDLVESTLFGHKKGSFTGAIADALGKFREADGGTLFLDEIGELPLESQAKLLRALQEREVQPIGFNKPIPVNIRIIAATNRNPLHAVQMGHLREDLFYRLNVFPIHIPPLRERSDDVRALADFFLKRYAGLEDKRIYAFTADAIQWLGLHNWPGNVRELENTIFRAVLLCDGEQIDIAHLTNIMAVPRHKTEAASGVGQDTAALHEGVVLKLLDDAGEFKSMADLRREVEQAALDFYKDNTTLAAQRLGIGKSTLYRHRQE